MSLHVHRIPPRFFATQPDFFGRDALVDELATAVEEALTREQKRDQHTRLLTILGASGSGKSSAVMAGLIPRLRAGKVLNSNEWVYLDPIVPGTDPLEALTITLKSHFPDTSFKTLLEDLEGDTSNGLYLLATQLVKKKEAKVVLLVDQFEEAFTLTTDEAKRRHFFDLLLTAATEPRSPLLILLTLRADVYDRPMQYPELYRLIDAHHVSVLPLERDELRSVIEQPANLPDVQLSFERGLVDELLSAMQGQSGALPLLEFTLDQLVQHRNGHQLTLHAYHEMGGVKGALSQYAEEIYQALPSDEHRQMARDLFVRLINPGLTEQDTTRRRAGRLEFERADPIQTQRMQETLEIFVRARLLTANQISGITTIEVSHEALIREWKRLAEWLREARDDILFQQSLSEDVAEWEQRQRPRDRLYRGVQLKEAQAWARRNRPSEQEVAFLRASATQRTLVFGSLIVVVLLLLSSIGTAGWFFYNQPPSPTLVTTLQDYVDGSLRYCINKAPSGSTITFAPGLRGTIELEGDLIFVSGKRLTIAGPGANRLTISGGNRDAIIRVPEGATLNISGLSFKNSQTRVYAFLSNQGTLRMTSSIISNNEESVNGVAYGGGIYNYDTGVLTMINSTISGNTARSSNGRSSGQGGGIENSGTLTVINSTISGNTVVGSGGNGLGGGIYNYPTGTVTVINSTISGNTARSSSGYGFGGGIYNGGTVTVTNSTISGNTARSSSSNGQGGGIDNEGKLTVTNSTLRDNTAVSSSGPGFGGGITNFKTGTILVTSSTFSANKVSGKQGGQGGGIDNEGKLTMTESTFSNNTASGGNDFGGGGISSSGPKGSSTLIRFCTFYGNTSSAGGGIWVDPTGSNVTTISSTIVAANSAHDGPDISGALISDGYNLIENVAGAKGLKAMTDKQVAFADLKIDPTFRDNGGPTQTLALLPGSPAIDTIPGQACSITITDVSGHTETITTDQRGDSRPDASENVCDIGAYESSGSGTN